MSSLKMTPEEEATHLKAVVESQHPETQGCSESDHLQIRINHLSALYRQACRREAQLQAEIERLVSTGPSLSQKLAEKRKRRALGNSVQKFCITLKRSKSGQWSSYVMSAPDEAPAKEEKATAAAAAAAAPSSAQLGQVGSIIENSEDAWP